MKIKRCSNCFQSKPVSEFYPNRTAKHPSNAFQSYCKLCKRETFRGWKFRKREIDRNQRILKNEKYLEIFNERLKNGKQKK